MAKLLVQETTGAREFDLVDREVNLGRELDNALRLSDPSVSRHHAVIRQGPGGYEIEDLQSSNGVLLNGVRVQSSPLRDGDRITLGQIQITFVDPASSSPLGTVRMDAAAMARFREQTLEAATTVPARPVASLPSVAAAPPAPPPGLPEAAPGGKPGPAFLHPCLPEVPDDAVPLVNPDGTVQRADLGPRLLAALIDFSPMLALSLLATLLSAGVLAVFSVLFTLANLALSVAYLILMPLYWMRCGASPGKKFMRLRVVPEANPAGRLDLNGALLRLSGYLANGAIAWVLRDILFRILAPAGLLGQGTAGPFAAWTLGLGMASMVIGLLPYLLILRPDRRALEDIFSRSVVIKVDR